MIADRLSDGAFAAPLSRLGRLTWPSVQRRLARLLHYTVEDRIYRISAEEAAQLPAGADFARDRREDLELFVPSEPRFSRTACLREWDARLRKGEHVYTRVCDGRLATFGWLIERQKISRLGWSLQTLELPDDSAVIYDFYTIPEYRNRDFYQRLLMHTLQDASRIPKTRWIYIGVRGDDPVPRWWVERLGAEYCESYFYSRVLWRKRQWRERHA